MTGRLLGTSLLDSVALTATSAAGAYTVSNLVATQPGKLWRSTSAAAQTITGDLGEDKRINGFVLYAHNLSNDGSATVQLTLSNNSGHTDQVYDTTVEATDPLYGWGEGGYGMEGYGGYPIGARLRKRVDRLSPFPESGALPTTIF